MTEQPGSFTARLEVLGALKAQRDPAVVLRELFSRQRAAACGRIVEMEIAFVESLEHDEMTELPEQDQRHLHLFQGLGAQAQAPAFEPVVPGGAGDACGAAAVAAHLALFAQFGERHPTPEVGEHHAKAGGTALRGVHLQQDRRGRPLFRGLRLGLAARPFAGSARRHPTTVPFQKAQSEAAGRVPW